MALDVDEVQVLLEHVVLLLLLLVEAVDRVQLPLQLPLGQQGELDVQGQQAAENIVDGGHAHIEGVVVFVAVIGDHCADDDVHQNHQGHQHQHGGAADAQVLVFADHRAKGDGHEPVYNAVGIHIYQRQEQSGQPGGALAVHLHGQPGVEAGGHHDEIIELKGDMLHRIGRHGAEEDMEEGLPAAQHQRPDGHGEEGEKEHGAVQGVVSQSGRGHRDGHAQQGRQDNAEGIVVLFLQAEGEEKLGHQNFGHKDRFVPEQLGNLIHDYSILPMYSLSALRKGFRLAWLMASQSSPTNTLKSFTCRT